MNCDNKYPIAPPSLPSPDKVSDKLDGYNTFKNANAESIKIMIPEIDESVLNFILVPRNLRDKRNANIANITIPYPSDKYLVL